MVKKSKYSILKGKTGKSKKVVVMGKKKVLYKKVGSTAMYVLSKGRHIRLSVYKKSKMKGGNAEQDGGAKRKRRKRRTLGGMEMLEKIMGQNQDGGAKRKRRKRRTKK
tara:strand:- start:267 stop:590 length:324 start_codon:yes stop_codon:yes gene_type:complete